MHQCLARVSRAGALAAMSGVQLAVYVLLLAVATCSLKGVAAAAEVAGLDHDLELHDPAHAADLALQTEMMNYYCERYPDTSVCHGFESERTRGDHTLKPVEHLQEHEDDEVHRVYCADGAPGHTGNPKLCDEYEQRKRDRLRNNILKDQVRREPDLPQCMCNVLVRE